MKILEIRAIQGPNYWSNYRKKLILIKLDLQHFEDLPSNLIPGFNLRLMELLPTLIDHHCSLKCKGGFLQRLENGTWLGHVVEHVALELQTLIGLDCGYGRTRGTKDQGIYNIVFSYLDEEAGIIAGTRAVELVHTLAANKPYTSLQENLQELKDIVAKNKYGPSTEAIVTAAVARDIPVTRLDNESLVMLGYGVKQKIIRATICDTSFIGVDIVGDKALTKKILAAEFIPTPKGVVVNSVDELDQVLEVIDFPWVIKPDNGNHGRGITTNINSKKQASQAFNIAHKVSPNIIVEKFIEGQDYRFLVVNYKLIAAAARFAAMIIGDGVSTIRELIDQVNNKPERGQAHEKVLTAIKIEETTLSILKKNHLTLDSVLPENQQLRLKHAANISSGGTAMDVTASVHPENVFMAERIARLLNLNICGIDIMAKAVDVPITAENGAILEVNAAPGLRMHLAPSHGKKRNIGKHILDMLYPYNDTARIPLIAVTGTNGKTTVVRLIAHLASHVGYAVGFTSTEGIYINNHLIYKGDCSGPKSAAAVLRDPIVNFAVLECARGGILRSGLAFDKCDISVITNISSDHLGLDGIETIEDLVQVKSVVAHSTANNGYAILNADDPLVYQMREHLSCHIALFALEANEAIIQHCQREGVATYIKNGQVIIQQGKLVKSIMAVNDIPITYNGTASCMIQNVLPAVAAAYLSHIAIENIVAGLRSFLPTPELLPGRMNIFNINGSKIILDYAHNEAAFQEMKKYMSTVQAKKKIGIIAATGDRREEDIINIGYYSAQIFDEIIIRHDSDSRGKSNAQLTNLLVQGIKRVTDRNIYRVISDELAALHFTLENSLANSVIFYFPDKVLTAIEYLKKVQLGKNLNIDQREMA